MRNLRLEPAGTCAADLQEYIALFAHCFPKAKKLDSQYLQWQYVDNPIGRVIGFNAFDGSRLVAHYAVIPVSVDYEGQRHLACWSLNTASHPEYQGRGLFTRLAEQTYEAARQRGCVA